MGIEKDSTEGHLEMKCTAFSIPIREMNNAGEKAGIPARALIHDSISTRG